jgi:hypothetical protein
MGCMSLEVEIFKFKLKGPLGPFGVSGIMLGLDFKS